MTPEMNVLDPEVTAFERQPELSGISRRSVHCLIRPMSAPDFALWSSHNNH